MELVKPFLFVLDSVPVSEGCLRTGHGSYLKVATKFTVGQPRTKDLRAFVLPSPTSSTQLAVHMSVNLILFFILKLLLYLVR